MTTVLLIHGGCGKTTWTLRCSGVTQESSRGLQGFGFEVLAAPRLRRPTCWHAEVAYLAPVLPGRPVIVMAGSNGCSVAARLAQAYPSVVDRLILAWPATAGDPAIDAYDRARLVGLGASPEIIQELLAGQTLRGLTSTELASLAMPVGVLPSVPANPFHQQHTADALLDLLPAAQELPGSPEPPRPEFPPHLEPVLGTVAAFALR
jgi:pimeloyl-ACP methyl ester carboxylesterase